MPFRENIDIEIFERFGTAIYWFLAYVFDWLETETAEQSYRLQVSLQKNSMKSRKTREPRVVIEKPVGIRLEVKLHDTEWPKCIQTVREWEKNPEVTKEVEALGRRITLAIDATQFHSGVNKILPQMVILKSIFKKVDFAPLLTLWHELEGYFAQVQNGEVQWSSEHQSSSPEKINKVPAKKQQIRKPLESKPPIFKRKKMIKLSAVETQSLQIARWLHHCIVKTFPDAFPNEKLEELEKTSSKKENIELRRKMVKSQYAKSIAMHSVEKTHLMTYFSLYTLAMEGILRQVSSISTGLGQETYSIMNSALDFFNFTVEKRNRECDVVHQEILQEQEAAAVMKLRLQVLQKEHDDDMQNEIWFWYDIYQENHQIEVLQREEKWQEFSLQAMHKATQTIQAACGKQAWLLKNDADTECTKMETNSALLLDTPQSKTALVVEILNLCRSYVHVALPLPVAYCIKGSILAAPNISSVETKRNNVKIPTLKKQSALRKRSDVLEKRNSNVKVHTVTNEELHLLGDMNKYLRQITNITSPSELKVEMSTQVGRGDWEISTKNGKEMSSHTATTIVKTSSRRHLDVNDFTSGKAYQVPTKLRHRMSKEFSKSFKRVHKTSQMITHEDVGELPPLFLSGLCIQVPLEFSEPYVEMKAVQASILNIFNAREQDLEMLHGVEFADYVYEYFLELHNDPVLGTVKFIVFCISVARHVKEASGWLELFCKFIGIGNMLPKTALDSFTFCRMHLKPARVLPELHDEDTGEEIWVLLSDESNAEDKKEQQSNQQDQKTDWVLMETALDSIRLLFQDQSLESVQVLLAACAEMAQPIQLQTEIVDNVVKHRDSQVLPVEAFLVYVMDAWASNNEVYLKSLEITLLASTTAPDSSVVLSSFLDLFQPSFLDTIHPEHHKKIIELATAVYVQTIREVDLSDTKSNGTPDLLSLIENTNRSFNIVHTGEEATGWGKSNTGLLEMLLICLHENNIKINSSEKLIIAEPEKRSLAELSSMWTLQRKIFLHDIQTLSEDSMPAVDTCLQHVAHFEELLENNKIPPAITNASYALAIQSMNRARLEHEVIVRHNKKAAGRELAKSAAENHKRLSISSTVSSVPKSESRKTSNSSSKSGCSRNTSLSQKSSPRKKTNELQKAVPVSKKR